MGDKSGVRKDGVCWDCTVGDEGGGEEGLHIFRGCADDIKSGISHFKSPPAIVSSFLLKGQVMEALQASELAKPVLPDAERAPCTLRLPLTIAHLLPADNQQEQTMHLPYPHTRAGVQVLLLIASANFRALASLFTEYFTTNDRTLMQCPIAIEIYANLLAHWQAESRCDMRPSTKNVLCFLFGTAVYTGRPQGLHSAEATPHVDGQEIEHTHQCKLRLAVVYTLRRFDGAALGGDVRQQKGCKHFKCCVFAAQQGLQMRMLMVDTSDMVAKEQVRIIMVDTCNMVAKEQVISLRCMLAMGFFEAGIAVYPAADHHHGVMQLAGLHKATKEHCGSSGPILNFVHMACFTPISSPLLYRWSASTHPFPPPTSHPSRVAPLCVLAAASPHTPAVFSLWGRVGACIVAG
eukprot:1142509-Pelagomonas_calceolata.AAC.6